MNTTVTARIHDGSAIDVHIHGSGPTILMHPIYSTPGAPPEVQQAISMIHAALIESLADRYRLVLFDYPQGPWPNTMTPANVVADLSAIADAAEAEQYAWCGYSWTAVIGLQLALDNDRMTGLICGGWPPLNAPYGEMDRIIESVLAGTDPGPLSMMPLPVLRQFATFYKGLQTFDDSEAQTRIRCPRLCFVGSADNIYDTHIGQRVIDAQPQLEASGWKVRVEEGLDHGDLLQPDVLIPILAGWLDGHIAH